MTHKQIERYRKELTDILTGPEVTEKKSKEIRLGELAAKVGTSRNARSSEGGHTASEPELVENIHLALQTASMIDMCRTASKNYWIAFICALVALAAAMAAWAAVYLNILDAMEKTLF